MAPYSASPPPPLSFHLFIPPSHPPHFLPSLPWSQALDCFHKHTRTHKRHHIGTLKTTSQCQSVLPSQSHCWRNQAKGVIDETDWIQRCREGEVRPRILLLSHATFATPMMTSPRPETFKLRLWLSAISSVCGWQIPEDLQKSFGGCWKFEKENEHGNVSVFIFIFVYGVLNERLVKPCWCQSWVHLRMKLQTEQILDTRLRFETKGQVQIQSMIVYATTVFKHVWFYSSLKDIKQDSYHKLLVKPNHVRLLWQTPVCTELSKVEFYCYLKGGVCDSNPLHVFLSNSISSHGPLAVVQSALKICPVFALSPVNGKQRK